MNVMDRRPIQKRKTEVKYMGKIHLIMIVNL